MTSLLYFLNAIHYVFWHFILHALKHYWKSEVWRHGENVRKIKYFTACEPTSELRLPELFGGSRVVLMILDVWNVSISLHIVWVDPSYKTTSRHFMATHNKNEYFILLFVEILPALVWAVASVLKHNNLHVPNIAFAEINFYFLEQFHPSFFWKREKKRYQLG